MGDEVERTDSDRQLKYRTYLDERKLLVAAECEVAGRFDKGLLTMAGGTLLLSMTFVKDIASNPHHTWALFSSWVLLASAVCAMLMSLLTSQQAFQFQRTILDDGLEDKKTLLPKNSPARKTRWLNRVSIVCFFVAIAVLGVFIYANMPGDQ